MNKRLAPRTRDFVSRLVDLAVSALANLVAHDLKHVDEALAPVTVRPLVHLLQTRQTSRHGETKTDKRLDSEEKQLAPRQNGQAIYYTRCGLVQKVLI